VTVGEAGAKIEVEIDCDSIYTDDKKLTQHLKSGDFFAVKDHPKSTFKSTKVEKKDSGAVVTGTLAIRGKEKEISFPVEMQAGDTLVLKGEFKINRTDWGMTYGAGMIDDDVTIKVKVEAKK
jgi:polyisoprenoid-binding protein YceI